MHGWGFKEWNWAGGGHKFSLKNIFSFFFLFFRLKFQHFHSASLCPKTHLIRFKSESVINLEKREGSKPNVPCFNMVYVHHPRANMLYTAGDWIDSNCNT